MHETKNSRAGDGCAVHAFKAEELYKAGKADEASKLLKERWDCNGTGGRRYCLMYYKEAWSTKSRKANPIDACIHYSISVHSVNIVLSLAQSICLPSSTIEHL